MSIESPSPSGASAPIGVFDSGVGGLSVLRHIRALLPAEHLLYAADAGFAPYGERSEDELVARSLSVAHFLLGRGVKAMVVACNTATAAAVVALRARYPQLILVGVEPGLKPAASASLLHKVGVLATASTLASARFIALQRQIEVTHGVQFLTQACNGLAAQIERGELSCAPTVELVERYVAPLIAGGADVLVLGCTHYPFVLPLIQDCAARHAPAPVAIIDTGAAVARQLLRLLNERALLQTPESATQTQTLGRLEGFTSGSTMALRNAFMQLLDLEPPVSRMQDGATSTQSDQFAVRGTSSP